MTQLRDRIKEFARIPVAKLRANPRNWRTHPEAQRKALRGMLNEIGFSSAVIARELPDGTYELIDGHLRLETMGPNDKVPTLILDVDEGEADKLLLTLDPLAAMAGTDKEMLAGLFESTSFDDDALASLIADTTGYEFDIDDDDQDGEDAEPQIDKAEELRAKWGVERGHLWRLGEHLLLCGDSTHVGDVNKVLRGDQPLLMVTDPPYGVEYDANWRNEADRANGKPYGDRAVGKVHNDNRADWTEAWQLFPGEIAYVWHAGCRAGEVAKSLENAAFSIRSQIVWAKNNFAISRGDYHWKHEPCWYAVRKGGKSHWAGDRSQTTVWEIDKPMKSETGHSTQKPVECMAWAIQNHASEIVYEPFSGSGTTLIACENLGRKCRAIEISPAYVAVALQRWADHTGGTPELVR